MSNLYTSGEYLKRNPGYHEEDSAWKARHILRILKKNRIEPASVCEIGCGAGKILHELSKAMPTVSFTGYDIAPRAIEIADRYSAENLEFQLGDFLALDSNDYDALLCIDVIEHIEDDYNFLKGIKHRAINKIFHIPLENSLYKKIVPGRLSISTKRYGHINFYDKKTALNLLDSAGYKIKDWFYTQPGIDCSKTFEARLGSVPAGIVSVISDGLSAKLFGAHAMMVLAQ